VRSGYHIQESLEWMRGSVEFASDVTPIELQLIMESSTGEQWTL
jgi:hypothetical protein